MNKREQPRDDLADEVAFWRGFIEWWVRENARPVPPRAWDALHAAERKRIASMG